MITKFNNLAVTVNGRNAEFITIFNVLEIKDATWHYSNVLDMTKYKSINYYAANWLGVPVGLTVFQNTYQSKIPCIYNYATETWDIQSNSELVIPSNVNRLYLVNSIAPWLETFIANDLKFYCMAENAPTSGAFTLFAYGIPN